MSLSVALHVAGFDPMGLTHQVPNLKYVYGECMTTKKIAVNRHHCTWIR